MANELLCSRGHRAATVEYSLAGEKNEEGTDGKEEVERRPRQLFVRELFQFQSWEVFVLNPITAIVGNR